MIFVTGTKRSGTSMWMQILIQAGFPYIGEPYPRNWVHSIQDANKEGFYESSLRKGIYYQTNPNPNTGSYLFPAKTRRHVLKVFIPGLVRSDVAFIDNVVGTIRPWREYVESIRRLYDMEDTHLATLETPAGKNISPLEHARLMRGDLHPALEWWKENYDLIRNFITRRFAFNLVSYQKLLDEPAGVIPPVIEWCGGGDIEKAVAAVRPKLNTQKDILSIPDSPLTSAQEAIFDDLHQHFYDQVPLRASFIEELNKVDDVLRPMIQENRVNGVKRLQDALRAAGHTEAAVQTISANQEDLQNDMGF